MAWYRFTRLNSSMWLFQRVRGSMTDTDKRKQKQHKMHKILVFLGFPLLNTSRRCSIIGRSPAVERSKQIGTRYMQQWLSL